MDNGGRGRMIDQMNLLNKNSGAGSGRLLAENSASPLGQNYSICVFAALVAVQAPL
jgi:hypothetical protein